MSLATVLVALSAVGALAVFGGFVAGLRELAAFVRVRPSTLQERVRVVIPARNEAERLPVTLDALLADPSPHLEVVVYDDRSTDGTRALLDERARVEPRLLVLHGDEEPPAGQFGKPVALARAVRGADQQRGRHDGLLLFLDADVTLAADVVGGLVTALRDTGADALSGVPRFASVSVAEQLVVPVITSLVGMRYPPRAVHDPRSEKALLNGQLILVKRAALDDVGGFQAVCDAILEDVALARLLKAAGKPLRLAQLQPFVTTRMYTSWREIQEGFGKNAVALFGGPWRTLFTAVAALLLASLPWAGVVASVVVREPRLLVVAMTSLLVAMAAQAATRRSLWLPVWPVVVLPLAYAGAAYVLAYAALRVLFGRDVTWRGRTYRASSK